ncbi:MAG: hypothetical protein H7839_17555, partial [Magnetococcus sp. YQC-5]
MSQPLPPDGSLFFLWMQLNDADRMIAGGKGWNLARLARQGFQVPSGGVLTAAAYHLFVDQHGICPQLNNLTNSGDETLISLSADVRRIFLELPLPERVSTALDVAIKELHSFPLVVRSSAVDEDSSRASFAGIYRSFLNVIDRTALEVAIRECWASAWSPRAVTYRRRLGVATHNTAMAVVIMRMVEEVVPSFASGVAFSCDPSSGREDRVFISANFGLGETVVRGGADPDSFLVDVGFHAPRQRVVEHYIGRKERVSLPDQRGGVREESVEFSHRVTLDDAHILILTRLILRVAFALGYDEEHQDVEWAWDGQRFWILQSRPVTVLPNHTYKSLEKQSVLWSNGNIRDSLPITFTPLLWSLVKTPINSVLETLFIYAGVSNCPGINRVKLHRGRGYFNVSVMQWENFNFFGISPKQFNLLIGGHQGEIATPVKLSIPTALRRLRANLRIGMTLRGIRKKINKIFEDTIGETEDWRLRSWQNETDALLGRSLGETLSMFEKRREVLLILGTGAASFMLLVALLERFLPGEGAGLARSLLVDGRATSSEHGLRLAELAELAIHEPQARLLLEQDASRWKELPEDSLFRRGMTSFLEDFGHRAVYELDLRQPRWREDPSWLLETIRGMMSDSIGMETIRRRQEASRAAWHKVATRIPFLLRSVVRFLVGQAIHEAAQREMAKSVLVRF